MDSTSQRDSSTDGGGGTPPDTPPRDEGRPPPQPPSQAHNEPPDPGLNFCPPRPLHTPLSLDQIRITGSCNEYTDGPTVAQRSPASQQRKPALRAGGGQETREERPNNLRNHLHSLPQHGNTNSSFSSSSVEESHHSSSIRRPSLESSSSGQRLLLSNNSPIIRTQPTPPRIELHSEEELKPLNNESRAGAVVVAVPGTIRNSNDSKNQSIHSDKCLDCGRCCCVACRRPRVLPSRWMCGRRCVCSLQNAVEYGTCACCVKGLFYHCSSDDEDTCADKPFSCKQGGCCVRWTAVSLLSLLLPCLLCYLPAKCCVGACQGCYDRATRPGCRCKNPNLIHCEDVGKPTS